MEIKAGTRLGRYLVRSRLGSGGMGEVFLAHDADLDRPVALKILSEEIAEDRSRVLRFAQEARAASALSHPNVAHVYEVGSSENTHYIAMELITGETVREKLARGRLAVEEAVDIAAQTSLALAAAHEQGIVHRDIKPDNVMVRPDGYVKVLDFGLAKLRETMTNEAATAVKTQSGIIVGTLAYMSPEQIHGDTVDASADLFSLGVLLYEMLAGERPFRGTTRSEIIAAILTQEPPSLGKLRSEVPKELASLVASLLEKEKIRRPASAADVHAALREIGADSAASVRIASGPMRLHHRRGVRAPIVAVVMIAIAALAGAIAWAVHRSRVKTGEEMLGKAATLAAAQKYAEAYDLVTAAAALVPGEPRLAELRTATTTKLAATSVPPGASVFLQRFGGPPSRSLAGSTPLDVTVPIGDYIVTLEKKGYAPAIRAFSAIPLTLPGGVKIAVPIPPIEATLVPAAVAPAGMVDVKGGMYRLRAWSRPTDKSANLSDFFIDRREVTNGEFEDFVRAGGYRKRELWKAPFVKDGRTIAFEQAMRELRDASGMNAPRGWSGGRPPAGREAYPVTGVTWYEAAAFAEWKGKKLPTVFQWERAARPDIATPWGSTMPWGRVPEGSDVTERANFSQKEMLPAESMPFGLSPWGALHMAGNAAEWCRNPKGPGFAVRGGSFEDAIYNFGHTGGYPPFYSSPTLGFRCVLERNPEGDQGAFALSSGVVVPRYERLDGATFSETILPAYDYPKTALDAKVVEVRDEKGWRREKIAFTAAGGKRAIAFLYLPKGFTGKRQVIHFIPAGDVASGLRRLPDSIEARMMPFVLEGRAIFSVALEGYLDRPYPKGFEFPRNDGSEYAEFVAGRVTDLRRGLDYLETRSDLDVSRTALVAPSSGGGVGIIIAAVEPRYRSVVVLGCGLSPSEQINPPAARRSNFAPHIAAPKLMIQGKYDESLAFETEALPLYNLFSEPKRLEVYEGGHIQSINDMVASITPFLDETLGPP